jgi:hypothetical protein
MFWTLFNATPEDLALVSSWWNRPVVRVSNHIPNRQWP